MQAIGKLASLLLLFAFARSAMAEDAESAAARVAQEFINDYLQLIQSPDYRTEERARRFRSDARLSKEFKERFARMEREIHRVSEIGWDYDPVLNAQDFPDRGFRVVDLKAGGKDRMVGKLKALEPGWPSVPFSVVLEGEHWKIDSIGAIR